MDDDHTPAPPPDKQTAKVIPLRGHWLDPDQLVPVRHPPRLAAEEDDLALLGADGIWDDNPAAHEVCDTAPSPDPPAGVEQGVVVASPAPAWRRWGAGVVGLAVALIVVLASLSGHEDSSRPASVAQTHTSVLATRPAVLNAPHAAPRPRPLKHARRAGPRKARPKARRARTVHHKPIRHVSSTPAPTPRPAPVAVSHTSAQPTVTPQPATPAPRPTTPYAPATAPAVHSSPPRAPYPEFGP
jgi:hypothetical protein